jgi:competence protein ComEC
VAFILGAASSLSFATWSAFISSFILLVVAVILAVKKRLVLATISLLVGFFSLGVSSFGVVYRNLEQQSLLEFFDSKGDVIWEIPTLVTGHLEHEPITGKDSTSLALSVESLEVRRRLCKLSGGLRVHVRGDEAFRSRLDELRTGDGIRLWAFLKRPHGYGNPGGFDIAEYYRRRGITLSGSTKSALLVEPCERGSWWERATSLARSWIRRRVERAFVGFEDRVYGKRRRSEVPGVVLALLIGDRSLLPQWAAELYQEAGTFHVMAISGMHVGLLALLIYGAVRKAGMDQDPALLLLFVILPMYASLCGGRPSVVRAVLMCLCVSGAKLLSINSPGLNGLALAALILLALRPMDLHDPGFQLSFLAACGILVFAGYIGGKLALRWGRLGEWLGLSLAAQIGVVPIMAWHFLRLTPAAVVANLVVLPLAAALMAVGAVVAFMAPVPWIGDAVVWLAWLLVKSLTLSSQVALALPLGSLRVPLPSPCWFAAYAMMFSVAIVARGKWRGTMGIGLGLLVVVLLVQPSPPTASDSLRITAFDVGHGDALLLEFPGNERLLVDGGGSFRRSFDVGERVLVPALLSRGIRTLDGILATHADQDHIGGLHAVVSNLRVRQFWGGVPAWDDEAYRELRARIDERGVDFRQLRAGDELIRGEVKVRVLYAGGTDDVGENESSLVLLVTYGRARLLLTGDAGVSTELALLRVGQVPRVEVLKVGHHGSQHSTMVPFLEALSPRIALVSAPSTGFVRLPSPWVLRRLKQRGITILRTDRDGAITLSVDKQANISVETFRASRLSSTPGMIH